MSEKKKLQLGMNPSTAYGRLVKDIIWNFVEKTGYSDCCKCGLPMTRDTFSIEHVVPWLDSENPIALYFDLNNIDFSHMKCNRADARPRQSNLSHGTRNKYKQGCRCEPCKEAYSIWNTEKYCPDRRQAQYLRTGK